MCRKKKHHKEEKEKKKEEGEEEDADMWVKKALLQVVASFDSVWLANLEGEVCHRLRLQYHCVQL